MSLSQKMDFDHKIHPAWEILFRSTTSVFFPVSNQDAHLPTPHVHTTAEWLCVPGGTGRIVQGSQGQGQFPSKPHVLLKNPHQFALYSKVWMHFITIKRMWSCCCCWYFPSRYSNKNQCPLKKNHIYMVALQTPLTPARCTPGWEACGARDRYISIEVKEHGNIF